ncbi:MAG: hypothetical protein ABDH18_03930 [Aquificaceae bacterium]
MVKSSYNLGGGRWRLSFYNSIEREHFERTLKNSNLFDVLESGNTSLLVKVRSTEIEQILNASRNQLVDRADIHFYLSFFIKHPFVKAVFSISMLGFWAGLISFGVCSMIFMPYIRSRF